MNQPNPRLLVVDDDDAGRYVKLHVLHRCGYVVDEVASGRAALEACELATPDLVILDTILPDIGGTEVCRDIKARWPHVVVLQTSAAHSSTRSRVRALEGGADGFLIEPIEPEELVASVRALLRMHHAEQSVRRLNADLHALVERRTEQLAETRRNLEIEIASRQKAEEVVRHAQKLDAIGQLTGGIAHDFNNLLAVILASLGMVRAAFDGRRNYPPAKIKLLIDAAETAADRGTKVIQQLLAFARRGALANVVVVVDEVLAGCEAFLRRAVGEAVTLRIVNSENLWSTRLDPVQLEAALLNLAVNARDAMPQGGVLTIETANVHVRDGSVGVPPGRYVRLCVTDTGTGMEPEIAKRAFEPFFTTKEVGHGTGLGLSQVYGFVTQSGGHVTVETRPGEGASFIIHLPRCDPASTMLWAAGGEADVPTGDETILVVEDDTGVRDLAVMMIGDFGYRVLAAPDGPSALDLLRYGEPVDLLFSDVVMPGGINGFELVRKARELRGDLKALITSGYVNVRVDEDAPKLPVLAKPYSRSELAHRLRRALDAA
jgi:signal transduction histidine kinase